MYDRFVQEHIFIYHKHKLLFNFVNLKLDY